MTTFVTPAPPASTKKAKDLLFKNNRIRKRDKCQDPPTSFPCRRHNVWSHIKEMRGVLILVLELRNSTLHLFQTGFCCGVFVAPL